jgi:hypothetical protein
MDLEEEVRETISGYNHRTFPSDYRWRDEEEGMYWRKCGLYAFDFKGRNLRGRVPSGIRHLVRHACGYTVKLEVEIERACIQSPGVVGDSVATGHGEVTYSTNCGRATLQLLRISIQERGRTN